MSGKTTFIRTIGINALLATTIYTCTSTKAVLPFYNIYSVIKIEDDIETGVSYYFEELLRLKELVEISNADEKQCNLFLIDEILKGTNIHDRTRIAKSILNYLTGSNRNMIMVTSHDIDLAAQLKDEFDFYYFKENIYEKDLEFDYKIYKGLSTKSNAVNLLKILDFPEKIIMGSNE
jgi:DNA mismatch repair ATPase MutS